MPNNISFEEILNALPQTDKRTEPEVIQARKKHARSYIADPIKFLIKMYNQFFIFYYRNESI